MADSTVFLKYDTEGLKFSLSENGTFTVVSKDTFTGKPSPGKSITWKVVSGGGIDSIKKIDVHKAKDPDDKHKDIWSQIPKKDDSKGLSWTGTLKSDAMVGTWDGYDITVDTTLYGTKKIDPKVPTDPGP